MYKSKTSRKEPLSKLFYPKSIAVIGASTEKDKIGGYIFSEIIRLNNIKPYPINVKWKEVMGKKAYVNVKEIKDSVDLAIIAIPQKYVESAMKDCIEKNIKNIIIISAGFKEVGEEGRLREEQIKKLAKNNGINLIGPNCLGTINAEISLNCSFAKDIPKSGGISLISQSGAVIDAIIDWSFKYDIGFSKIVSLGNMAGVDELEMLQYLKDDPKTESIVFYMETLEKGKEFAKVLNEVTKKKPVIIIKPGSSDNAKKAIGSHTGSLAQDNILVKTLIEDNNGILVESINELFNMMIALNSKLPKNNKLVILTNAGGPGVISTDICEKTGFELYRLDDKQKKRFTFLPKEASLNNPIDIIGDAKSDRYKNSLDELVKIKDIGNILVLLTPQMMTDNEEIAKKLVEIKKKTDKAVFSCFLGDKEIRHAIKHMNINKFSNFLTPSDALLAMDKLRIYNKSISEKNRDIKLTFDMEEVKKIQKILDEREGLLDFKLTKRVMKNVFSIHIPDRMVFDNTHDIIKASLDPKKTYVLKVDGKDFVHKKDIGGVVKDITSLNFTDIAIELYEKLSKENKQFSLTLEEEVKGTEVITGIKQDTELGDFIMFGMGGTYVNIFKDVYFSTCPINQTKAKELIMKSKIYPILEGYRNSPKVDLNKLAIMLSKLSYMGELFPQIKEVDLNPVICNDKGVYPVDIKLIVKHN